MTTENTTESVIPIVRDINVLLSLDTYQGMTDEEIDSVIDYKIEQALNEESFSTSLSEIQATYQARRDASAAVAQDSAAMLQYRLNQSIPYITSVFEGTANNE